MNKTKEILPKTRYGLPPGGRLVHHERTFPGVEGGKLANLKVRISQLGDLAIAPCPQAYQGNQRRFLEAASQRSSSGRGVGRLDADMGTETLLRGSIGLCRDGGSMMIDHVFP